MRKTAVRGSAIAQEEKTTSGTKPTNLEEQSHLLVNGMSVDAMLVGHDAHSICSLPTEKDTRTTNTIVRRSARLKNVPLPGGTQAVNPVVEHVNPIGSDKERVPHSQPVNTLPTLNEQNMEGGPRVGQGNTAPKKCESGVMGMLHYLVRAVDEFKSQGFGQAPTSSNEDPPGFSYKTLYLDAQKKIDALIEENYELIKKLEYTCGKVAAYERMKDAANGSKEVLFVRATEGAAVSISPQVIHNLTSPPPPPPPPPTSSAGAVGAVDSKGKCNSKKRKAKA